MQYNHYANGRHVHPPSPPDFPPPYPDPSHHHAAITYATVSPAPQMSPGSMVRVSPHYSYSPYAAQSSQPVADDHRPYFATTSQGAAMEHYPTPSSPTSSYVTPSGHMDPHAPRHAHLSRQQQFIPTPSQTYQVYSSAASTSSPRSRSSVEPYYHMSPNPQHVVHSPSPPHGGRSTHVSNPSNSSTVAGERYPCDLCDRSFTRLHDRRRHYETVHATSPVLHKCRFCRKDFSRADSLKRHIDNGCDEMPR